MRPYFFGTAAYFAWNALHSTYPESGFVYLKQVVLGLGVGHLYFLFILLALYLVTPILQGIDRVSDRALGGTIIALFLVDSIERAISPWGMSLGYLALGNCMSYLPYFLLGHYVYTRKQISMQFALVGFIVSTSVTMLMVWLSIVHPMTGFGYNEAMDYQTPNLILESFFAFNLTLHVKIESEKAKRVIAWLSAQTLGIYIFQTMVIHEVQLRGPLFSQLPAAVPIIFFPLVIFAFTAVAVWGLRTFKPLQGFI